METIFIIIGLLITAIGIFFHSFIAEAGKDTWIYIKNKTIPSRDEDSKTNQKKEPEWTAFQKVVSNGFPPLDKAMTVKIQFELHSPDNTVPLMVKVAATKTGSYQNIVSGPAAIVEQLIIEPSTYYVSTSHPSIQWTSSILGWQDPDL